MGSNKEVQSIITRAKCWYGSTTLSQEAAVLLYREGLLHCLPNVCNKQIINTNPDIKKRSQTIIQELFCTENGNRFWKVFKTKDSWETIHDILVYEKIWTSLFAGMHLQNQNGLRETFVAFIRVNAIYSCCWRMWTQRKMHDTQSEKTVLMLWSVTRRKKQNWEAGVM